MTESVFKAPKQSSKLQHKCIWRNAVAVMKLPCVLEEVRVEVQAIGEVDVVEEVATNEVARPLEVKVDIRVTTKANKANSDDVSWLQIPWKFQMINPVPRMIKSMR